MKNVAHQLAPAKSKFHKIDHIAIAVRDLEEGIDFFVNVLGFELKRKRTITGQRSGMLSAEIEHNGIKFVLCQGTDPQSQVSRLIDNFGPGVAHIALAVDSAEAASQQMALQGLQFDTSVIHGAGLRQVFSTRDKNSGLSFEFIERNGEEGFLEENVNELFAQLEKSGAY
ncbi:VOC family protein [Massilia rubra]|uniref:Glyoxalase n=1 Tax=Massilia rubra TaxID=2607910 RepID=A0ABX0LN65_9BURK|nr:VOC family protein [Massilia rubra]NHZ35810.1 glyoxalase [Massilia rubra]